MSAMHDHPDPSDPSEPSELTGGTPASFGARVRRGLAWQLLGRGGEQGVRLLANLILARLLAPEQFGLLGMAATGLAVADALAFVGTDQAVMAERSGHRPRFVATAWFLSLVRGVVLSFFLFMLAVPLAGWFGQPDAAGLFMLIALQPLLLAAAHPGAFVPLRSLSFGRWTTARFTAVVLGTAATVVIALLLRDARALVIGQLATTALSSAATHLVTPRRLHVAPRPHRRHLRRLLRFSAGAIGTPVLIMIVVQAPVLLISSVLGPAVLGVYLMQRRLCDAGRQLALQAAGLVLVPASARLANDPTRFARAWFRALRPAAMIALTGASLIAWLGGDLPALLLGPMFRGPEGLFTALAMAGGWTSILAVAGPFAWGLARPDIDRTVQLVRVVVLLLLAVPLFRVMGPTGVAIATAVSAMTSVLAIAVLMQRQAAVPLSQTFTALAPGIALGTGVWIFGAAIDAALRPSPAVRIAIAAFLGLVIAAGWALPKLLHRLTIPTFATPGRAPGASA